VWRFFDRLGELVKVFEGKAAACLRQAATRGQIIEDLQGGDLVLVILDEFLEGLDDALGALQRVGAEAGLDDLVRADIVNYLLVPLL
jgi:hypothetical protein